jgi:hypothetical protein
MVFAVIAVKGFIITGKALIWRIRRLTERAFD